LKSEVEGTGLFVALSWEWRLVQMGWQSLIC